ncbi:MAG: ATP-binding protein, partial [Candidatus Xenobia bacterium]
MSETELPIASEADVVVARTAGRDLARRLGFGLVDQTRIATAISELTRNILLYAGSGL